MSFSFSFQTSKGCSIVRLKQFLRGNVRSQEDRWLSGILLRVGRPLIIPCQVFMSWWGANIFTHDLNHPLITKIYFVQIFEHVLFVFWSNTHCSELINSVGVVATSHCPFTMEVMFWYFVKETCNVITTAILRFVLFEQMQHLASHLFVEFSLQSHWHTHSKSRLGLRVWGARSSLWSDNVPSSHLANIYSSWFFHCRHGSLGGSFQSPMWLHLIFHYSKNSPFLCFWLLTPPFGLVCVFMSW
jgi:hypothetical protein